MKIAFLFPGQGSQKVGMGKDIYEKYDEAKVIYKKASEILNLEVEKLCFESEEEELNQTKNTQIAIVVTSLAILEVLKKHNINAEICAGLSLGEYVALIYGGFISFEDGIKLIQKRGQYMQENVQPGDYQMAAIIGLDSKEIERTCKEIDGFVVPANYNYSNQTVISGEREAIEKITEVLKQRGAKRVIPLKTSGPFHTEKLEEAKRLYQKELEKVDFKSGNVDIIKNLDGTLYKEADDMVEILANHIVNPVRFDKEIELMQREKVDLYVEVGPGKALTGFVKKEIPDAQTIAVGDIASLEALFQIENGSF